LKRLLRTLFGVITKRCEFELAQALARIHILDGLIIAVNNIDEVVEIIKKSKNTEDARARRRARRRSRRLEVQSQLSPTPLRGAAQQRESQPSPTQVVGDNGRDAHPDHVVLVKTCKCFYENSHDHDLCDDEYNFRK
jgi:DNA gyrase/topoisomerase IV subunit A